MSDAVLGKRLGKDHHLDPAGDVVEDEDRHAIAFLRFQRAQAADDAADPDVGQRPGQLGDALCAERLELVAEPFQRMAAHVETQGLFFERQLLRLGPRWRIRQRDRDGLVAIVRQIEERHHAVFAVALMPSAVLDRAIDRREQAGAPRADRAVGQRVERARLDEALERPLVHEPLIDALAEHEQRIDPSELGASRQHREDRALADILHRAETEAHAVALDRERQLDWN